MKIIDSAFDGAIKLVEKAGNGEEFEDVKKEMQRKKGFVSTSIVTLLTLFVASVIVIIYLAISLSKRPTQAAYDRQAKQIDEKDAFIRDMVPMSEREKQRSMQAVEIATDAKETVTNLKEEVEQVNPAIQTYNDSYKRKIKPNAK